MHFFKYTNVEICNRTESNSLTKVLLMVTRKCVTLFEFYLTGKAYLLLLPIENGKVFMK